MAHEDYLSRVHFGSLDGLRCASVLAVVWHHTATGVAWFPASDRGFLGVDMFFVISGFLIVTLLLRERDRTGGISLPRFYGRRTLRIFPIYYGVLAALTFVFLFVRPDGSQAGPFFDYLPFYLTYTSNWAADTGIMFIAWSLAAEEQFYVVWPPLEHRLRRRVLLAVLLLSRCDGPG